MNDILDTISIDLLLKAYRKEEDTLFHTVLILKFSKWGTQKVILAEINSESNTYNDSDIMRMNDDHMMILKLHI